MRKRRCWYRGLLSSDQSPVQSPSTAVPLRLASRRISSPSSTKRATSCSRGTSFSNAAQACSRGQSEAALPEWARPLFSSPDRGGGSSPAGLPASTLPAAPHSSPTGRARRTAWDKTLQQAVSQKTSCPAPIELGFARINSHRHQIGSCKMEARFSVFRGYG